MDAALVALSEASIAINRQLNESSESKQLPDLVKQYTAFFTSYNLLIGYAHLQKYDPKKFDADAVREQLDVAKTALMAFSKDNKTLAPKVAVLDETMVGSSKDSKAKTKAKKGGYEALVEAVEAKFGSFDSKIESVVIGAGENAPTYKFGGDVDRYYVRIYTKYQLLLQDLEALSMQPEAKRNDYLTRVLPNMLNDLTALDTSAASQAGLTSAKSITELLAMSGADYLRWLLVQLNLEHYVKEQRDSLLNSLRTKGLDASVKPGITHPLARAVAAAFSFMRQSDDQCVEAAERTFNELNDLNPTQLVEATQQLVRDLDELQKVTGQFHTFHNVREAVSYTYMPDLPLDINLAGTPLGTSIAVNDALMKTDLGEIRKVIGQYIARLDQAHKIIKPVEKYYVEMLTTMQKLHQCVDYIAANTNMTLVRIKLVSAFVKIAVLKELWRIRWQPLSREVAESNMNILETIDGRLRSMYAWDGKIYDDGLDFALIRALLVLV